MTSSPTRTQMHTFGGEMIGHTGTSCDISEVEFVLESLGLFHILKVSLCLIKDSFLKYGMLEKKLLL